jgi:sugar O-acyltransferase (sialic acid O-acetyltransferase NeuD family)
MNIELLEDFIKKKNYNIIIPDDYNIGDQIDIFSNCKILISFVGSGLTNMLFMPKYSTVYILCPNSKFSCHSFFRDLGKILDINIINIYCKPKYYIDNIYINNFEYIKGIGLKNHPLNAENIIDNDVINDLNKNLKKQIIIFGIGKIAEVAYYYLKNEDDLNIVGFTIEKNYIKDEKIKFNLPIIEYDNIENEYQPYYYLLFAPCTASNLNKFRERIYNTGKEKGYTFYTYISSKANIYTNEIGENCFILENNTIQPYTKIGNNCILWSGNHIGHHSIIEDNVFITSHVVISGMCLVKKYCYIGVNAAIKDNIILDEGTVVGMSASITKNTEANSIYVGIPAKLLRKCDDTIIL